MIEDDIVKSELGAQEGNYFDASDQPIGMRERNVSRGLTSAHGYIPNFDLHAKRSGVEAADLGAASGDALDFCDKPSADQSLGRGGGDVPEPYEEAQDADAHEDQQVFPPRAPGRLGGGLGHPRCSPSAAGRAIPGMPTSPSERRGCRHET